MLKTSTKKEKDVSIKFNIAPSKHYGFINFINLVLTQDNPVAISFEKISKTGDHEDSKIVGTFKFEGKDEAIKKLPEDQRNMILLRDYEGYSYKEIGEILKFSESQVKVYIFRARKFLQQYLKSVESII